MRKICLKEQGIPCGGEMIDRSELILALQIQEALHKIEKAKETYVPKPMGPCDEKLPIMQPLAIVTLSMATMVAMGASLYYR